MTRSTRIAGLAHIALALCTVVGSAVAAAKPDHPAPVTTETPAPETDEAPLFETGPVPLITDPAHFTARIVAAHNDLRTAWRAAPLLWDDRLSVDAAAYARQMAETGAFEHAPQTGQGENLWMGSAGYYDVDAMIAMWSDEAVQFKPGRFPDVAVRGGWMDVGHFTQMIWPTTTHVGCAVSRGVTDDYLVCRYSPPGNVTGANIP
ncbi:MAG: hypothetical protein RLZZ58_1322 [Pseudomonadota bacterium]